MAKQFYLGQRSNPQLNKSYFVAYGQLTKKDAREKEKCAYGSMSLTGYDNQEAYEQAISMAKDNGYTVNVRAETIAKIVKK